jgi:CheY-like chemotaxis protein
VLIVDESAESREVLRELLERRGVATIESRRPEQAVQLTDLHRPDLILFDAESDHSEKCAATSELEAAAGRYETPLVILGKVGGSGRPGCGQIVSKPYHYGPLLRKIEALLAAA